MPISRVFSGLIAVFFLGGCLGPATEEVRDAPDRVSVTRNKVVVAGPPGFCVDLDASRNSSDSAFVLLASCAAVSNQPLMPQPDIPVLLTASVAEGGGLTPEKLGAYFRSPAGVAQLRDNGAVDSIRMEIDRDAFFIYTDGPDGDRWRGIIPLRPGIIVTLSLEPNGAVKISEKARFAALDAFARRIVAAN